MKKILSTLCLAFLIVIMTSPNWGEAASNIDLGEPAQRGVAIGIYSGEKYGKEDANSEDSLDAEERLKGLDIMEEYVKYLEKQGQSVSTIELQMAMDKYDSEKRKEDSDYEGYKNIVDRYFKLQFLKSYEDTMDSEKTKTPEELGEENGKTAGENAGEIAGRKDANDEEKSDWEEAILSSDKIESLYDLDRENSDYRIAFLAAYRKAFKEKYQETYSKVNYENSSGGSSETETDLEKRAKDKGKTAGETDGKKAGRKDAEADEDSDWEDSIESDDDIEDLYNLDREVDEYKEAFLEAYKEAFKTSYQETYSDVNYENSSGGTEREEDNVRTDALESGAMFGENDGFRAAIKDYHSGEQSDAEDALPRESEIIDKFMLDKQTYEYRLYFIRSYKEAFVAGYEKGFRDSNMDPRETAYNNGFAFGSDMGAKDGVASGANDYFSSKSNDWLGAIQSEDYLKTRYELYKEIDEYQQGFLNGYKISFQMSYVEQYTKSKTDLYDEKTKRAYDAGSEVGKQNGQYMGQNDYTNGRANNWRVSIETDSEIMAKYNLTKESVGYINDFISAYKENFMKSYAEAYQGASSDVLSQNVAFVEMNGYGGEVVYESPDEFKEVCTLEVPAGAILRKTSFAIEKREYLPYYFNNKYVPLTNVYNITVRNGKNSLDLQKPLTLNFKYYGPMDAGIYRNDGGKWNFVKSQVYRSEEDEGFIISTKISDKEYYGAQYVVLVDEGYVQIDDIDGHWAEDEINTFIRRKYVSGYPDHTFKPDYKVTRAEFVKILDNSMSLTKNNGNYYGRVNVFKDAITFGVFEESIMKAYSVGLINGYPDGTFRPNMHISYQEVEWIMKKMPGLDGFKWKKIAEKMQEEEGIASNSSRGMNQKINRAEVIYMLNDILNEEIGE